MRRSIDLIDRNILLLLAERQELARAIGHLKKGRRKGIVDTKREREIMRREINLARKLSLERHSVEELFRAIFHLARSVQRRSLPGGER
jgi:chorismate mutase